MDVDEHHLLVSQEVSNEESRFPRSAWAFLGALALIIGYALFLGGACSAIAFADPETRHEWAPVVVGALFPVGQLAFFLSQLIGGFLTAVGGLPVGNFGAAVPLFVSGVVVGLVHGALAVAVVCVFRWAGKIIFVRRRVQA